MLIHLGKDDFVHFDDCIGIFELETLSDLQRKLILSSIPNSEKIRAVALTVKGKWLPSPISTGALVGRCGKTMPGTIFKRRKRPAKKKVG